MTQTTSYGMGQYRYDKNFDYYTLLGTTTDSVSDPFLSKDYIDYSPQIGKTYRDIAIELPDNVQYGKTYYMSIDFPSLQNETLVNLKLCAANDDGTINTNKFQQIEHLIIPTNNGNNDFYSQVILFEYVQDQIPVTDVDIPKEYEIGNSVEAGHLYKRTNESGAVFIEYKFSIKSVSSEAHRSDIWDNDQYFIAITNYTEYSLLQEWKGNAANNSNNANNTLNNNSMLFSFDFIFSPRYNLSEEYKYLWIEIVHNDDQYLQYIIENITYTGKAFPLDSINMSIYKIHNLLAKDQHGIAPIKSGTTVLNSIIITGPTNLICAINGEDIRVGVSGQYQLENFDINFLGIKADKNSEDNDFLIDYTYKIES